MTINTSWRYEIVLRMDDYEFNDVIYYVVYRLPMVYTSSFSRLSIMLPPNIIQNINELIGQSKYPHVFIDIYSPDDLTGSRINLICSKPYRIINTIGEYNITSPKQLITLQLCNSVLYKMSTTFTFDKLIENKTGKEILDTYHEFIKIIYGDVFNIHYKCDLNNFFNHKYEQTIFHDNSDLLIPKNIIQSRCPSKFFPVYFFDDFYFGNTENNLINIFYLDFTDLNSHDQATNFSNLIESIFNIESKKIIPFGDNSKSLDKFNEYTSKTYIDLENMVSIPLQKQKGKNFTFINSTNELLIHPNKTIYNNDVTFGNDLIIDQSNFEMNLHFSDSINNIHERIQNCYNFFKDGPRSVRYVTTTYGLLDWVHFGFKYAIDPQTPQDYRFIPFNIINIFKRELKDIMSERTDSNIEPVWCKYFCKTVFLEYESKE